MGVVQASNMIIITFLAICTSYVLKFVIQWHYKIKWLNRKPFNCAVCLAGWLTLLFWLVPQIHILGWMAVSMTLGYVAFALINRL
jgi:hypothetical protein